MRRLPVFLVIDVSESMAGPSHDAVSQAIADMIKSLRTDPQALETVHLSIIAFAGKAKVVVPMTELLTFYPPEMPLGSGTGLGGALGLLMSEIDRQVVRTTPTTKGDWRPVVFLMTDGAPTDDPAAAIRRWREDYARRNQLIAVSVGAGADTSVLKQLTDDVILLSSTNPTTLYNLMKWISDSISVHSHGVQGAADRDGISLDKNLPADARKVEDAAAGMAVDERVVTFVGRCQQSEAPYLVRFERAGRAGAAPYTLRSTTAVRETFFELSEEGGLSAGTVSTSQLAGMPSCPHCGAGIGAVWCNCGHMHCIDGPGPAICPWCGGSADYVASEGHFDVGRSAG